MASVWQLTESLAPVSPIKLQAISYGRREHGGKLRRKGSRAFKKTNTDAERKYKSKNKTTCVSLLLGINMLMLNIVICNTIGSKHMTMYDAISILLSSMNTGCQLSCRAIAKTRSLDVGITVGKTDNCCSITIFVHLFPH
jgi:hypothetical protein